MDTMEDHNDFGSDFAILTGLCTPPPQSAVPEHFSSSPLNKDDQCLSKLTVKDLNKLMWLNFSQMQQTVSLNMLHNLRTVVPEYVKSGISETVKKVQALQADFEKTKLELNKVKKEQVSQADFEKTKLELNKVKAENDKLKATVAEQQRFLSRLDAEKRSMNVIITGVPEAPLEMGTSTVESDARKIEKIFEEIGCSNIAPAKIERLGQPTDTNQKRPLKVTVNSSKQKSDILSRAKNLKSATCNVLKRVFIKMDTNPMVRKELARLREVVKRERAKPENIGKKIHMDYKQRKVFVNNVEIDRFHPQTL